MTVAILPVRRQTSEVKVRGGGDVERLVERILDVNIVGSGSVE